MFFKLLTLHFKNKIIKDNIIKNNQKLHSFYENIEGKSEELTYVDNYGLTIDKVA